MSDCRVIIGSKSARRRRLDKLGLVSMRLSSLVVALALASCGGNQIGSGEADGAADNGPDESADSGSAGDGTAADSKAPTDEGSTESDSAETGASCQTCLHPGTTCCVMCSNGHLSCGYFGNACPPCP